MKEQQDKYSGRTYSGYISNYINHNKVILADFKTDDKEMFIGFREDVLGDVDFNDLVQILEKRGTVYLSTLCFKSINPDDYWLVDKYYINCIEEELNMPFFTVTESEILEKLVKKETNRVSAEGICNPKHSYCHGCRYDKLCSCRYLAILQKLEIIKNMSCMGQTGGEVLEKLVIKEINKLPESTCDPVHSYNRKIDNSIKYEDLCSCRYISVLQELQKGIRFLLNWPL